jgi:hypothetical protein
MVSASSSFPALSFVVPDPQQQRVKRAWGGDNKSGRARSAGGRVIALEHEAFNLILKTNDESQAIETLV